MYQREELTDTGSRGSNHVGLSRPPFVIHGNTQKKRRVSVSPKKSPFRLSLSPQKRPHVSESESPSKQRKMSKERTEQFEDDTPITSGNILQEILRDVHFIKEVYIYILFCFVLFLFFFFQLIFSYK